MEINKIYTGDCISGMAILPDESVNCCVTSPPYYGLRDYNTGKWVGGDEGCGHFRHEKNNNPDFLIQTRGKIAAGCGDAIYKNICKKCGATRVDDQIGLEESPVAYVQRLVDVFLQVHRITKPCGTLWLNIGDSYAGSGKGAGDNREDKGKQASNAGSIGVKHENFKNHGLKPKDLIGIPWMVAFALRASGWYLRQDIIWHKPNPMPESVIDRCTKAHEYIFLFSKSKKYYYDAESIKTPIKDASVQRLLQDIENQKGSHRVPGKTNGPMKALLPGRSPRKEVDTRGGNQGSFTGIPYTSMGRKGNGTDNSSALNGNGVKGHSGNFNANGELIGNGMANKKSVWTVTTKPFSEAHFATFPPELIVDCIKAGCPRGG